MLVTFQNSKVKDLKIGTMVFVVVDTRNKTPVPLLVTTDLPKKGPFLVGRVDRNCTVRCI